MIIVSSRLSRPLSCAYGTYTYFSSHMRLNTEVLLHLRNFCMVCWPWHRSRHCRQAGAGVGSSLCPRDSLFWCGDDVEEPRAHGEQRYMAGAARPMQPKVSGICLPPLSCWAPHHQITSIGSFLSRFLWEAVFCLMNWAAISQRPSWG